MLKIQINSQGCNDPPKQKSCGFNAGSIKVNGRERSVNRRGMNIVVIDYRNGRFVASRNFDTHTSRRNADQMVAFIDRIKPHSLVLVAAKDEFYRNMHNRGYSALVRILIWYSRETYIRGLRTSFTLDEFLSLVS